LNSAHKSTSVKGFPPDGPLNDNSKIPQRSALSDEVFPVAAVAKSVLLAFKSPGYTGIFLEPTIPLLRDVAIPAWEQFLDRFNIPYKFITAQLASLGEYLTVLFAASY